MKHIKTKIQRLEKRIIMLDNTIVQLRRSAWGNAARLKDCLREREEAFVKLKGLAAEV